MNNFVIIESGSTKSDWAFCIGNVKSIHSCHGINPITHAGFKNALPQAIIDALRSVDKVLFYGAGANSSVASNNLYAYFAPLIGRGTSIVIESDMMAAARACLGTKAGIVGILGTGSNSCVYDGSQIIEQVPSLGYMLSDEGSGNHIGKELLRHYFYGFMSKEDETLFQKKYELTRAKLLAEMYGDTNVSAYLASYAPFLQESSKALKERILNKVFNEFIELRIKMYTNYRNFEIHFVGSIASVFEDQLTKTLQSHKLNLTQVVKNPIQNLILYHKSREII